MIKRILALFLIAFLAAGCGALAPRDSAGADARIDRRNQAGEGSGAASVDGKGTEQKKDVK